MTLDELIAKYKTHGYFQLKPPKSPRKRRKQPVYIHSARAPHELRDAEVSTGAIVGCLAGAAPPWMETWRYTPASELDLRLWAINARVPYIPMMSRKKHFAIRDAQRSYDESENSEYDDSEERE